MYTNLFINRKPTNPPYAI